MESKFLFENSLLKVCQILVLRTEYKYVQLGSVQVNMEAKKSMQYYLEL
jgi:hypothetical protein